MASEVRDARIAQILDAALDALREQSPNKISMADLAKSSGVSRTAIYQYFSSVEDIFAELVINDMADLVNDIHENLQDIEDPLERINAWILRSLNHLSSGEHAIVRRLSEINIDQEKRGLFRVLHGQFMSELLDPLKELEIEQPDSLCAYISSVVNSAANRIDLGFDFAYEAEAAERFIMTSLKQLGR